MEEYVSKRKRKPMVKIKIGDTFNRLTVIGYDGKDKHGFKIWTCQCSCENKTIIHGISSNSLSSGNTKSCGCLMKEAAIKSGVERRKLNRYDLSGDYGIGYTSKDEPFYFDLEDYDKIKNYVWRYDVNKYVITIIWKNNKVDKRLPLHRFVFLNEEEFEAKTIDVDHKNHVPYDDRKSNLRKSDHYQNITHCKIYTNNTSGVKGVVYDKERNKWAATLTINKVRILNKRFNTFEEAVNARKEAEEIYQKEFQYHPEEDEYNFPNSD